MSETLTVIARIHSDFTTKFGIPRQSGLVEENISKIVFEPEFRDANALRGLEGFSHIWLIWGFSGVQMDKWQPMVKPPRLGGNTRKGVFATRSPFRPNRLGLSSVKLIKIQPEPNRGTVLYVSGADLMDGTPIYDIKPYLSFTDSHPDAVDGFAGERYGYSLNVEFPPHLLEMVEKSKRDALIASLKQDPRPAYKQGTSEPFGFEFSGLDVRFIVEEDTLRVTEIIKLEDKTSEVK